MIRSDKIQVGINTTDTQNYTLDGSTTPGQMRIYQGSDSTIGDILQINPFGANHLKTPAQFDVGTLIANTAFVQAALGNCASSVILVNGTNTFNPSQAGSILTVQGGTFNVTNGASVNRGAVIKIRATATTVIQASGSDIIVVGPTTVPAFNLFSGEELELTLIGKTPVPTWSVTNRVNCALPSGIPSQVPGQDISINLPGGFILKMGMSPPVGNAATYDGSFQTAFPNNPIYFVCSTYINTNNTCPVNGYLLNSSQYRIISSSAAAVPANVMWLALGY